MNRNHKVEPHVEEDSIWAEPLAGQLATLRVWRQCVNVLAVVAGTSLVLGVIAWLAFAPV